MYVISKIQAIILLFLLILIEAFAMYYVKKFSIESNKYWYFIGSTLLYACLPLVLYFALKNNEGLATTNIMWNIASTIYGIIIGVILFNETITYQQKIGAIIGFVGLLLMMFG